MVPEDQDRIVVVLVRARNPANIGAVARAMHDLGYSKLRVVNDFPVPFAAARSAVDAAEVLHAAVESSNVADAVHDCTLVLGTTAVGERVLEHPLHLLADASNLIRETLAGDPSAKVALLFGSEKTGLSNDELSHCHGLLTIPMNTRGGTRHLSMNLGQAVAVCLHAMLHTFTTSVRVEEQMNRATAGDLERLTALLGEVLETSGYARRHPANAGDANVRRLVRRMDPNASDAPVWTGILRQILYSLDRAGASERLDHPSNNEPRKGQISGEL